MQYYPDRHLTFDARMHKERLAALESRARQWKQWSAKSATDSSAVGLHVSAPLACCERENGYEARPFDSLDGYCNGEADTSKPWLPVVCFHRPLRTPFSISKFKFWARNHQFELRMRISKRQPTLTGLQNLEVHTISPGRLRKDFV